MKDIRLESKEVRSYTEEELQEKYNNKETVTGILLKVTPKYLVVDVGGNLGRLTLKAFDYKDPEGILEYKMGEVIECYIAKIKPKLVLDRVKLQEESIEYIENLKPGTIINTRVESVAPFGVFVELGVGVTALLPLVDISITKLQDISKVFKKGDTITVVYRGKNEKGYLVTHKELLGTWSENIARFFVGTVTVGKVQEVTKYGVFVELTPNLTGLADIPRDLDLRVGESITVKIKSYNTDKNHVKLNILCKTRKEYKTKYDYRQTSGIIDTWEYTPKDSKKKKLTDFSVINTRSKLEQVEIELECALNYFNNVVAGELITEAIESMNKALEELNKVRALNYLSKITLEEFEENLKDR